MSDTPKLQLGDPPSGLVRRQTLPRVVWLVVLLQIVTLVALEMLLVRPNAGNGEAVANPQRVDELRQTALSLEDRSLPAEAAAAWREYLEQAPAADDRAKVLYRVGGLLVDAEDYSGAASAYVEAEQAAAGDADLKAKIGPKIVECLRRLGRYGEVGRELSRQVEVGGSDTGGGKVLATFAGDKFTEADLDRAIERNVDRILAMQPEGAFPLSREQLLKQYESRDARMSLLQEIIQRELFSRRARELKLDREESFQQTREFVDNQLLASAFLSRELAKIQPTDVDIESYYTAHKSDYRQPESASVVLLPLHKDESAEDVLNKIQSAADFRKLADERNGDAEITPERIVKGQTDPRLGDTSALFELAEDEWTKTPVPSGDEKLLVLVESKTPATTPPLSEIRYRVEADYRRKKQKEFSEQLSADLMSRYHVKIVATPTAPKDVEPGQDNSSGDTQAEAHE